MHLTGLTTRACAWQRRPRGCWKLLLIEGRALNNQSTPLTEAAVAALMQMSPEYLAKYRKADPVFALTLSGVGRSPRYLPSNIEYLFGKHRGVPSDGGGSELKPAERDVPMDLSLPLLTTQQAAVVLGVEKSWFEKNRSCYPERLPPGYRFGRCWRYSEPELLAWMEMGGRSRLPRV